MNKSRLQEILSWPFEIETWRGALTEIFNVKHFLQQPQQILLPANDKAEAAFELGKFETEDDRLIGLYQVNVLPGVLLERNKVGLRGLLRNVYKYDVDGALIVFVQDEKWRLSFVSEIRALDEDGNIAKIATEPKRYTYLLGKDEKTRTSVDRLYAIAGKPQTLEDIRNAFSVEALNEEFYKTVARFFYQLVGATAGKRKKAVTYQRILELPGVNETQNDSRKLYQEFAVRLIGRIVFGWFLKMKKSDEGFPLLPEELLSSQSVKANQNYYHSILERLFFQTLNTPMDERVQGLPKGCEITPFLNGGLFESHPDDFYRPDNLTGLNKNLNTLRIPDYWFLEFFTELEKYNFTIDENSVVDIEVSVDPEMLGRIFENLLAEIDPDSRETARKTTGSYYTPREIVDYMATESLIYYLNSKTEIEIDTLRPIFKMDESVSFNRDNKEKILSALDKLTVLDPACGSGAFPIGVMQKIVMALQKLDPDSQWWKERQISRIQNAILQKQVREKLDTASVEYARKLGIIQNSLFGVDIQPIAAEISKLRCFLTLVVDETINDAQPNRGVEALPNLEFKFVTADTLIPLPAEKGQGSFFDNYDDLRVLSRLRKAYLQSYGQEKEEIKERFLQTQKKIFNKQVHSAFGSDERALKISMWNPFDHSKTDWFDPEWMFGEKDFDIVIGNPPYVQLQKEGGRLAKKYFREKYETFTKTGDIYSLFYETGFKLLSENGILVFITSNKWMRASYGKSTRQFFLKNTAVLELIDFGDARLFSNATTYTNVLIFQKNRTKNLIKVWDLSGNFKLGVSLQRNLALNDNYIPHFSDQSFILMNRKNKNIREHIEKISVRLKDWDIEIFRGVLTGFNKAFIIDEKTKNTLINEDPKNSKIIKPILRGRDIKKYRISNPNLWMICTFPSLNLDIDDYPAIKRYLERYLPKMKQTGEEFINSMGEAEKTRKKTGNAWFETQDQISYYQDFQRPKIIWAEIVDDAAFYYDKDKNYIEATCFMMVGENLKYILALLNSKPVTYFFKRFYAGGDLRGNYFRYKKAFIEKLPTPKISKQKQIPFESLAEFILTINKIEIQTPINEFVSKSHLAQQFEQILDAMVFELYFEEDFKKAGITFIPYVERDFPPIEGLSDEKKIETIRSVYKKLRQKDNEIMNNLKLMDIRLADLIGPIKAVG